MSTRLRYGRADLMRNLYHAHQFLDEYTGDANGKADLMRRVQRVTEEFHELGGSAEEFAEYAARQDAEAVAREVGVGNGTVQRIADEMRRPFVGVAA